MGLGRPQAWALPMAERCFFLSYEAVDEILEQPSLLHLPETIIEDYKEYFDAA
jgi:hypothetical protein